MACFSAYHTNLYYVLHVTTWQIGFPGGSDGKESACNAGDPGSIPVLARSLGKGMVTHSSILAWIFPWIEVPEDLYSTGSQRVGHDWVTNTFRCQIFFKCTRHFTNWGQFKNQCWLKNSDYSSLSEDITHDTV